MKHFLFIVSLFPLLVCGQLTPKQKFQVDSIRKVVAESKHDSTKINAWISWAKMVRKADPELYMTLLDRVENLADENLNKSITGKLEEFFLLSKSKVFNYHGDMHRGKGDYSDAINWYSKALAINQGLENLKEIAGSYNNIGIVYGIQAKYDTCTFYMKKSLAIQEELNDQDGIANAYNNIGNVHYYQGDFRNAIDYWTKSLKTKEKSGDKMGMANTINNIGNIHRSLNDHKKAIAYYSRSLKIYEDLEDLPGIVVSSYNIGNIYMEIGEDKQAFEILTRSLEISEKSENKRGIAGALNGLGSIYLDRKEFQNAEDYFLRSLSLHEEIDDQKGMSVSLNNLGILYKEMGAYRKGIMYAERSLVLSEEMSSLARIREASNTLWGLYKLAGNTAKSLEMHELYVASKDSLQSKEIQMEVIRQEYDYKYEKQSIADSIRSAEEVRVKDAEIAANEAENREQRKEKYFLFGGLGLALLFGAFIYNRFRLTRKQNEIIQTQKLQVDEAFHELEEKNQEILDSITYAKRIQSAILPPMKLIKQQLPESFVFYQPKDVVAGDFYWMEIQSSECREGPRWRRW